MGGRDQVLDAAKLALSDGDPQFAAELARFVVRLDNSDTDARDVKAAALRARGYRELNPIARAWYLHGALELEGAIDPAEMQQVGLAAFATISPALDAVESWRYLLDATAAGEDQFVVGFRVADTGEEVAVELRNSVLHSHGSIPAAPDATVTLTLEQLNNAGRPGGTFDDATVEGNGAAEQLLALLDREPSPFYMHLK